MNDGPGAGELNCFFVKPFNTIPFPVKPVYFSRKAAEDAKEIKNAKTFCHPENAQRSKDLWYTGKAGFFIAEYAGKESRDSSAFQASE